MKPDSYFIALSPPAEFSFKVQKYRDLVSSYSIFKTPLHITLIPPFYLELQEKEMVELLEKNIRKLSSREIVLKSIDYFEHRSSVVFMKPDQPSQLYLKTLFTAISAIIKGTIKRQFNKSPDANDFHPHLTIAKRIPLHKIPSLKKLFENFNEAFSFHAGDIDVYKQNNSYGPWTKIVEIPMQFVAKE